MQHVLFNTPNLTVKQAEVHDLLLLDLPPPVDIPSRYVLNTESTDSTNADSNSDWFSRQRARADASKAVVAGVVTSCGHRIPAAHVVLTTGTFLRSVLHVGPHAKVLAGRYGAPSSGGLAVSVERAGFRLGRVTTGTPPRILKGSIDVDRLERVSGDEAEPLSYLHSLDEVRERTRKQQLPVYQTMTNDATHEICRKHWNSLPKFEGNEGQGRGPRYCVSIDAKVQRFDREGHVVWLEMEGHGTDLVYPAGLSTYLPPPQQLEMLRSIKVSHASVFIFIIVLPL